MLKFLVDNNVPKSVSVFLKTKKYDVELVQDLNPEMTDLQVIAVARRENRIILSNDKDFVALSLGNADADTILSSYLSQSAEIRIAGLQRILPELKSGFGIVVLQ